MAADDGDKSGERGGKPPGGPEKPEGGLKGHPILLVGGLTVLALVALAALIFWLNARNYQATDDAYVDTHIVRLAPQVAGRVTQVLVDDNQLVQAGQPLVTLDSADVQTRVSQAEAQRSQAQAQVDNAKVQIQANQASYQQALADVAAAQAQADNAARDLDRYRQLLADNPAAVSQQQLDQAVAQARQTGAQQNAATKAAAARAEQVKASRTQVTSGEDQVRAAQSELDEAGVNLGYTRIVAPVAGHVAQKTVAVGNYAQAGTQLLAIVPLNVWVTANYKETQLALMRIGQTATIKVDACPKAHITGHVDSIQRGAGQAFGILPPENATGNFVKVVQRVPVKIVFDNPPADCPLGPGMSVDPSVRVR
ncbi:MAG: HlyD family secretion protein [Caulobacteraceae bacterium]|nr:HlyD family secretion protein [Caulobacteraceae bacterium]